MFPIEIETLARLLVEDCRERRLRLVAAESCTGGLVSAAITAVPGASEMFDRGLITYSNRAKQELLGVAGDVLADYGAVSEPVARMMAEGALAASNAHISVAVTGVAGPGGGTDLKPIGLVHLATARANGSVMHRVERFGDIGRGQIQLGAVRMALEMLRERVG